MTPDQPTRADYLEHEAQQIAQTLMHIEGADHWPPSAVIAVGFRYLGAVLSVEGERTRQLLREPA